MGALKADSEHWEVSLAGSRSESPTFISRGML
jgi:hypothetical protein